MTKKGWEFAMRFSKKVNWVMVCVTISTFLKFASHKYSSFSDVLLGMALGTVICYWLVWYLLRDKD